MKVRETRSALQRIGCRRMRCKGSHEIWSTPGGFTLPPLKINHQGNDISRGVLSTYRRILAKEGLDLPS